MAQIPILSGFLSDGADFIESYPVNMEPIISESGLSSAFLKRPFGATKLFDGPGIDRGAVNWKGEHYRVMGSKLILVGASVTIIGDVGNDGLPVTIDYSFDRLSVTSAGLLFYWNGTTFTAVTDPDLGVANDHIWIAGYFMTTDGRSLVVTELNDPAAVDPLKYGSSETDPDPIYGLFRLRNEAYALNRYTIDVFRNIGGIGFPFERVNGATIPKGAIGRYAKARFGDTFAFVGSGREEGLGVHQAGSGLSSKISTRAIDKFLADEEFPDLIKCEAISQDDEQRLFVHLSDMTLVYYAKASVLAQKPIWAIRRGGYGLDQPYSIRNPIIVGNKWFVGSGSEIGVLDEVATDFDQPKGYQFDTVFLYNEGKGGIVRTLELVGTPGIAKFGSDPRVEFSVSLDGRQFSKVKSIQTGKFGETQKRIQIRPAWRMRQRCVIRIRGVNEEAQAWAGLEIDVEPLNA